MSTRAEALGTILEFPLREGRDAHLQQTSERLEALNNHRDRDRANGRSHLPELELRRAARCA